MNNSLLSSALLFVFASFVIAGCSGGEEVEGQKYKNGIHRFSMIFPEGWEVTEQYGEDEPVVAASKLDPEDPEFMLAYITVEVIELPDKPGLDEYFNFIRKQQSHEASYYSEHGYGEIKINGRKAMYHFFDVDFEDTYVRLLGYTLVKKDRGYLITCGAEPEDFSTYHDIFRHSAYTFRID
ncbi:MAG: hypothetical protein KOO63_10425 [Bacteroidales bacterium]|nr:hypothetical protein [Candidatus Latescibacterota bacterium]